LVLWRGGPPAAPDSASAPLRIHVVRGDPDGAGRVLCRLAIQANTIGCDSRAGSVLGDAWNRGKRICTDFAIIATRVGVGDAAWALNSEGQGPGWALRFQEIFAY